MEDDHVALTLLVGFLLRAELRVAELVSSCVRIEAVSRLCVVWVLVLVVLCLFVVVVIFGRRNDGGELHGGELLRQAILSL
jgi:hypothetical protein